MRLDGFGLDGEALSLETHGDHISVAQRTPDGPRGIRRLGYAQVRHAAVGGFALDPAAEEPDGIELTVGYLPNSTAAAGDAGLEETWLGFSVLTLHLGVEQLHEAVAMAADIRDARVRLQRAAVPHGSLAAPRRGPDGLRADVQQAAQRCTVPLTFDDVVGASHAARDDEYVLELSPSKSIFLVVVTTLRLFLIRRADWKGDVAESPMDSFLSFSSTHAQIPGTPCLALSRGSTHVYFVLDTPAEAERLVAGARFALDVLTRDDAVEPVRPSSAELFDRWLALRQASELSTLDGEEVRTLARELFVAARAT